MNANKQTSWQLCIYDNRIWWKIWLWPKFTSEVQLSEIINKRNIVLGYYDAYHVCNLNILHVMCSRNFFLHYVKMTNKPNVAGYAYCTIVVYVVSILVIIIKKKSKSINCPHVAGWKLDSCRISKNIRIEYSINTTTRGLFHLVRWSLINRVMAWHSPESSLASCVHELNP